MSMFISSYKINMIVFTGIVVGYIAASIIGKKSDNDGLGIIIGVIIVIISIIISVNVKEQRKQEELDNCPRVINPYQVGSLSYDGFEFAKTSPSSRYCPYDDYQFFYENYCPNVREYSKQYQLCVELANIYFNEGCEEYFDLKDLRKQCIDDVEKKYSDD